MISDIQIADYTYELPNERIAKHPLAKRAESKILVYKNGSIKESRFTDVPELIPRNSRLVFNNTRVVQARLLFEKTKGAKPIEVFCLEPYGQDVESAMSSVHSVVFQCFVGNARRWKDGLQLRMELEGDGNLLFAEKISRESESFLIKFTWNTNESFSEILENVGKVPLPPYLKRDSEDEDKLRYQTVYAKTNGSVAAPTAGLHFTKEIIEKIRAEGIGISETTLHVGAGTFKPVTSQYIGDHVMHAEEIHVKIELLEELINHQGTLIGAGTTSVRTLESLYWMGVKCLVNDEIAIEDLKLNQWDAYELAQETPVKDALISLKNRIKKEGKEFFSQTQLIIAPGYKFRVVDALFTNFHQPGSTLILLVAAAIGQSWREVYNFALEHDFRFLSYGDSSLLFIPDKNKA